MMREVRDKAPGIGGIQGKERVHSIANGEPCESKRYIRKGEEKDAGAGETRDILET